MKYLVLFDNLHSITVKDCKYLSSDETATIFEKPDATRLSLNTARVLVIEEIKEEEDNA